ncbi:MAG: FISUMP domain-containing protein [Saprospiraceae bacterium]
MKYVLMFLVLLQSGFSYSQVRDFDGNTYDTVAIGNQVWLKQYIRSKHNSEGIAVKAQNYKPVNGDEKLVEKYGYLYNFDGYTSGETTHRIHGICPEGYRIPSRSEIHELMLYLKADTTWLWKGAYNNVGLNLQDTSWGTGTNTTGMSLLPSGLAVPTNNPMFSNFGSITDFPLIDGVELLEVNVSENNDQVILLKYDINFFKSTYFSCKCIKASSTAVGDINKFKDINILYPNPSNNLISLDKSMNEPYTLYNMNGQMIKKGYLIFGKLNVQELNSGIYLLQVRYKESRRTFKIEKL